MARYEAIPAWRADAASGGVRRGARGVALDRAARLALRLVRGSTALVLGVDGTAYAVAAAPGSRIRVPVERNAALARSLETCFTGRGALVVDDTRRGVGRTDAAFAALGAAAVIALPVLEQGMPAAHLCVFDMVPRAWEDDDVAALRELAAGLGTELDLRASVRSIGRREAELRRMYACLPLGVVISSLGGDVVWANDAACATIGRSNAELEGMKLAHVRGGRASEAEEARVERALADGEHVVFEETLARPDGSKAWLRVNLSVARDEEGSPELVIAVLEDVTLRRELETTALRNELRYRALIQALPNCAVVLFDRERRHLIADGDALLAAAGLSRDMVLGRTIDEIVSPVNARTMIDLYDDALVGLSRYLEVTRHERTYALYSAPVHDGDGVTGGLVLMYDITRRIEMEHQLRERTRRLELLERIADVANRSTSSREALRECLDVVCTYTNRAFGHVFLPDTTGRRVTSSGIVHAPGAAMEAFAAATLGASFAPGEGFVGGVFAAGEAHWTDDLTAPRFLRHAAAAASGLVGGAAFPVLVGEELVAIIELYGASDSRPETELLEVMMATGVQLARVFERERFEQQEKMRAVTDELTGLLNRRGFLASGGELLRAARTGGRDLTLFFADVDGLKYVNDTLGHAEGDAVIGEAAHVLSGAFTGDAVVARLGGDEFLVLAEVDAGVDVTALLARIEQRLARRNEDPSRRYDLAMSIGVTAISASSTGDITDCIAVADAAMYRLKRERKRLRKTLAPAGPASQRSVRIASTIAGSRIPSTRIE